MDEVADRKVHPLTSAEKQAIDSLLGSASTSHPSAIVEPLDSIEPLEPLESLDPLGLPSPSALPEWLESGPDLAAEPLHKVLPKAAPKRHTPRQLPLAFLRALDWPLKKIAGEENEILHNFLRIMASAVLAILLYVGVRMVPQWIGNAGHPAAEAEVAKSIPTAATTSPAPADSLPAALDLPEDYTNAIGMQFKLIPSGEFLMGSPADDGYKEDDETPQHRVQITKPFYLGIHEVTQEQYEKVMDKNPSHIKGPSRPVEMVSWEDAIEFCRKLSEMDGRNDYRLPTEAEWEYACRAGTSTRYSCGDELDPACAWFWDTSDRQTHPVGENRPNDWGLYDMHGNVYEWCSDWYDSDYFGSSPSADPTGPLTGSYRVYRGGSWDSSVWLCRSALRSGISPGYRPYNLGFRVALVPPESMALPEDTMPPPEPEPEPTPRPEPETTTSPPPPPDATLEVPEEHTNDIGMQFKLIPAGEFMMGSPADDPDSSSNETPQHRVQITKPFYLGAYEVTQEQYEKVMGKNPSNFKGPANPVEQVSWEDATEFCRKLSEMDDKNAYRLPTEAEWEYACRAGTSTRYNCGDELDLACAWFEDNSDDKTHPVGEKRPNGWGLYDMHGNVWEWCSDWHGSDYYRHSPAADPTGPSTGSGRMLRGGSWRLSPRSCRSAGRGRSWPVYRDNDLGFRVIAGREKADDAQLASRAPVANDRDLAEPTRDMRTTPLETIVYEATLGSLPKAQGWKTLELGASSTSTVSGGVMQHRTAAQNSVCSWWKSSNSAFDFDAAEVVLEAELQVDSSNYREMAQNASQPDRWRTGYGLAVTDSKNRSFVVGIAENGIRLTNHARDWASADSTSFHSLDTTSNYNVYRLVVSGGMAELFVNGSSVFSLPTGSVFTAWETTSSFRFGDLSVNAESVTHLRYVRGSLFPATTERPVPTTDRLNHKAAPISQEITNAIGMQFKLIPSGEFLMGSPEDDSYKEDDETPQHRVQITRPFYLGIHEVTQKQYEKVMGKNPSNSKGPSNPVEQVSWRMQPSFAGSCRRWTARTLIVFRRRRSGSMRAEREQARDTVVVTS